ncbi:AtpZ/AtpI family protein [Brevundimonas sp.]|uniref:AtpZ/AtpI family protein n=1 Tax=Brevundimonas sp. TaxID=1871086 RepID=UPI002FD93AB1
MSQTPESREQAIARLQKSASELETRTASQISQELAGQKAAGQAWKIIADLFGGVLVGLAIGFGVDHFAGTSPVGILSGVLLGFALSVWMAWRTARRIQAEAIKAGVQPQAVPFDDDEEEDA